MIVAKMSCNPSQKETKKLPVMWVLKYHKISVFKDNQNQKYSCCNEEQKYLQTQNYYK